MFAGLDYGTSNCAIGVWQQQRPALVALEGERTLIPSTLYAPRHDLVMQAVDAGRYGKLERDRFVQARRDAAERAQRPFEQQSLDVPERVPGRVPERVRERALSELRFGRAAIEAYLHDPSEGFYVKSPKSFLGARGLSEEVQERFVAIVAAMITNIVRRVQHYTGQPLRSVVIGRPVNFQGAGGDDDNRRALSMLKDAARQAGFEHVEFLYEPMAAAIELESKIREEKLVLVVDIGGGTTDCSFIRIGPRRRQLRSRDDDVLGHSGERLGGNDYDQMLAFHGLMPALGLGDHLKSGLPLPNVVFMDAVSVNDVNAQQRFYSAPVREQLLRYCREAVHAKPCERLLKMRDGRATYRVVAAAERAKIALSDHERSPVDLSFLDTGLTLEVDSAQLRRAAERLLVHLQGLVREVLLQSEQTPDLVYLTGGMSSSPLARACVQQVLPNVPVQDSDHFLSVTEGLTIWSQRLFASG